VATATPAASIPLHPGATDLHSLTAPPLGEIGFRPWLRHTSHPLAWAFTTCSSPVIFSHHSNIAVRFGLSLDSYTERGLAARPISSWSVLTAAEDWGKSSWLCSRENISALPGTGIDRWTEYSPSIATSTRHTTSLRRAISLGAHMLLWNMPPPWPRSTVRNLTFCTSSTVSIGHPVGHVAVRYRVEFGNVPSAISRAASEINSDFIVLGVQRSSGALDRFLWPIAYELVRSATGPVLTIRGSGPHR